MKITYSKYYLVFNLDGKIALYRPFGKEFVVWYKWHEYEDEMTPSLLLKWLDEHDSTLEKLLECAKNPSYR